MHFRRNPFHTYFKYHLKGFALSAFLVLSPIELYGLELPLTIDLKSPLIEANGASTVEGGRITIPSQRIAIQAKEMRYHREERLDQGFDRDELSNSHLLVKAANEVVLEYHNYLIIADRFDYDSLSGEGSAYKVRTAFKGWYVYADEMVLYPNKEFELRGVKMSTSSSMNPEWFVAVDGLKGRIDSNKVEVSQVEFHCFGKRCWSRTKIHDFDLIKEKYFPFTLEVRAGGGSKVGLRLKYKAIQTENLLGTLYGDLRIKKGLGAGFDLSYRSPNSRASLDMQNYLLFEKKSNLSNHSTRYRFTGEYRNQLGPEKQWNLLAQYDKLSDNEMVNDFKVKGIQGHRYNPTQLILYRPTDLGLFSIHTRVRVHGFEGLKQTLPAMQWNLHPTYIFNSPLLFQQNLSWEYCDYRYPKTWSNLNPVQYGMYNSSRARFQPKISLPLYWNSFRLTPFVGGEFTHYSTSRNRGGDIFQAVGVTGYNLSYLHNVTQATLAHSLMPYMQHRIESSPHIPYSRVPVFDSQDVRAGVQQIRWGFKHKIKDRSDAYRWMQYDLYTYSFYSNRYKGHQVPRLYADVGFQFCKDLVHKVGFVWNRSRKSVDGWRFKTDYAYSANLAFGLEWRYRSAYLWRKTESNNFALEYLMDERQLLASRFSDRQHAVIAKIAYRFAPDWECTLKGYRGWRPTPKKNDYSYTATLAKEFPSKIKLKMTMAHAKTEKFMLAIGLEI